MPTNADATSTTYTPYAAAMPQLAITRPPSAGPVANASAWLVDAIVTARGKRSRGTRPGRSAERAGASNAPATAATNTAA